MNLEILEHFSGFCPPQKKSKKKFPSEAKAPPEHISSQAGAHKAEAAAAPAKVPWMIMNSWVEPAAIKHLPKLQGKKCAFHVNFFMFLCISMAWMFKIWKPGSHGCDHDC